jgi:hypothetical protein
MTGEQRDEFDLLLGAGERRRDAARLAALGGDVKVGR